jgi:imidazolonepropionase
MTPEETMLGVTRHAAAVLGMSETRGSIEVGKAADLAVWSCAHPRELAYYLGFNQLKTTFVNGIEYRRH